jgi:hypothetical protein
VDECAANTAVCTSNSYCSNKVDGYDCLCDDGYTKVGDLCLDVNECLGDNACNAELGICVNEDGGYA